LERSLYGEDTKAIVDVKKRQIITTVDAVGLFCPLPVARLSQQLERLEEDSVVELLADDPGVMEDIPAWCNETGTKLLSMEQNEEGIIVAKVKKERK